MVTDPLGEILGMTEYGRFKAAPGRQYAYVPFKDIWSDEVRDTPLSESSDGQSDGESDGTSDDDSSTDQQPIKPTSPNSKKTEPRTEAIKARRRDPLKTLNATDSSDEESDDLIRAIDPDHRKPTTKPVTNPPQNQAKLSNEEILEMSTEGSDQLFSSSSEEGIAKITTPNSPPQHKKSVRWKRGVKTPATKPTLVSLFEDIQRSKDKLVFIKFKPYGSTTFLWALVQVDLDATNAERARKKGVYRCRWYGPHPEDIKHKTIREARFWPIVRRLDQDEFFREQHIQFHQKR